MFTPGKPVGQKEEPRSPFGDDGKPSIIMPESPLSKYQQTHSVPINKAYDASYYTERSTFSATHPIPSLLNHSSSMPQLRSSSIQSTFPCDEYTHVQRAVAASQLSRKFDKKKLPDGESTTSMQLAEAARLDSFFRSRENEVINPERVLKRGQCIHKKAFRICKKCNPKPPKKKKENKKDGDDGDDDDDEEEERKREEEERKKEEEEERLKKEEEEKKKKEEEEAKKSLEETKIVYIDEGECKNPIQEKRLIKACKNGNLKAFNRALEHGARRDFKDQNGWTPLIFAAYYGHTEIVQQLVDMEQYVNIDSKTKGDLTALMWATSRGHIDVISILKEKGAKIRFTASKSKLEKKKKNENLERQNWLSAATNGGMECVEVLTDTKHLRVIGSNGKTRPLGDKLAETLGENDGNEDVDAPVADEGEGAEEAEGAEVAEEEGGEAEEGGGEGGGDGDGDGDD